MSDLHWHAAAAVGGARGGGPVASLPIAHHAEVARRLGHWVVARSVIKAILASECNLVFLAELGERVGEHGHLIRVAVPDEVVVPLTPRLCLELLRDLLPVELRDRDDLLRHEVVVQLAVPQRLLLVFL